MKRAFHTFFCVLAALYLVGGHWGAMQVVAWANMFRDYSAQSGLLQGLQNTFDGEHPCGMCHKIAQSKGQSPDKAPLAADKLDSSLKWVTLAETADLPGNIWHEPAMGLPAMAPQLLHAQWGVAPPTPPPRLGA